jgi:hypothetical protein
MFGSNYSLADVAAATGNKDDGMFGNNGWWIILLFLFTGFGGNGWGGRGGSTKEEIASGFALNNLENGVRSIQQGLCDGFYAMNTSMLTGFNGINQAITADTIANMQHTNILENTIQNLGSQMASCCCDIKTDMSRGFADLGYALATQSCATRQAITDSTRAILDFLTQDKIATLTAENQNLKFAASQQAQNAYLVSTIGPKYPIPAYVVPNPYNPTTTTTGA